MTDNSSSSPFAGVRRVVDVAVDVSTQAVDRLIKEGFDPETAESIVKSNFDRVNRNPNLYLTPEELCRPID